MKKIEGVDFAEYLEFCATQEAQSLKQISTSTDEIWSLIAEGETHYGDETPWPRSSEKIRFRPGELTIWAGVNGHGKSMVLSHATAKWMLGGPVAVASFEMPITHLGKRLAQQLIGREFMTIEEFGFAMASTDDRYWVYDETDSVEPERVLGMVIYAAKELACRHVVIDSLVKCGLRMSQHEATQQQKDFVDRLAWAAKTYKTHIHLVHHMRKGESERVPGGKFDVKGAGEITDLADNVILVWRNKVKEEKVQDNEASEDDLAQPDAVLTVAKQRHGSWEGKIPLWFDKSSCQYLDNGNEIPRNMVRLK